TRSTACTCHPHAGHLTSRVQIAGTSSRGPVNGPESLGRCTAFRERQTAKSNPCKWGWPKVTYLQIAVTRAPPAKPATMATDDLTAALVTYQRYDHIVTGDRRPR